MKYSLVIDIFLQGYKKERPKIGLTIHTQQEAQYRSRNFQATLKKYSVFLSQVSVEKNPL
ncbi:hypothetical protein IIO_05791 [Bacillus cereus VD115]|nr:hypothetical protein IIO_05791 [Bacillus cereus VD115]